MHLFLAVEDTQSAQGQGLHLVFSGDDHHPTQVVEIVDDHAGELFGVGQPPGEDDRVGLPQTEAARFAINFAICSAIAS